MKMLAIACAMFLAACAPEQQITTTRQIVVMPEESMFNCERFARWPETSRLTAVQVSRMIVDMYAVNEQCYNSQQTLRRFLDEARNRVQAPQ